ncbi:MAG: hypothetical protein JWP97_1733 [Labilithrix sp.]|nr:hypothetical protein [Labilithrix sp.]
MTAARQVVPNRTYLISRRCTQRQMLLRPDVDTDRIYLYCLAEAVERYGVVLHGFIAMSNHQHLVIRDPTGNFPDFLAHLNKMIAKTMNVLRGRWENFWATEQPNAVHLVQPSDCFDKLVYVLTNPVNDHLVEHARDWPGACSFGLHFSGRPLTIARPRQFFDPDGRMPPHATLRIERPLGFESLSELQWTAKLQRAISSVEEDARRRRLRDGLRVLGRKAVLRVSPTDVPSSMAERGGLRPHVACRNGAARRNALASLAVFRRRRREALERHLAGERDVVFPYGTFRARGFIVIADDDAELQRTLDRTVVSAPGVTRTVAGSDQRDARRAPSLATA